MTYPAHSNKQGPERFSAPKAKGDRNTFTDPLSTSDPNPTNDHYDPTHPGDGERRSGSEGSRQTAPHTRSSGVDPVPAVMDATTPGKVRQVSP